jgi:predicted XRE-type DNA-binding protein
MGELKQPHWTDSTSSFVAKISADFVLQIEQELDKRPLSQAEFASLLGVTEGSVSQKFNHPPNFKLSTAVEFVRAIGRKVALVAYDDGDPNNERGPINSEMFYECWKRAGRPIDFFDLALTPPQQSVGSQMVAVQSVSGLEGDWSLNGLGIANKKPPERVLSGELSGDSNKVAGL